MTIRELFEEAERKGVADLPLKVRLLVEQDFGSWNLLRNAMDLEAPGITSGCAVLIGEDVPWDW